MTDDDILARIPDLWSLAERLKVHEPHLAEIADALEAAQAYIAELEDERDELLQLHNKEWRRAVAAEAEAARYRAAVEPDAARLRWQLNEAVSLLREMETKCYMPSVLREELLEALPAMQEALIATEREPSE